MFALVITEKGGEQRRIVFNKPEVTIGRVQGNDIVLPKGNVSKRHARIVLKDGKFIVVDLKSTNGTYVNGRKITSPLVVKENDKIYIGDFIMGVEEDSAGGSISSASGAMSDASLPGLSDASLPGLADASLPGLADVSLPAMADVSLSAVSDASLPAMASSPLRESPSAPPPHSASPELLRAALQRQEPPRSTGSVDIVLPRPPASATLPPPPPSFRPGTQDSHLRVPRPPAGGTLPAGSSGSGGVPAPPPTAGPTSLPAAHATEKAATLPPSAAPGGERPALDAQPIAAPSVQTRVARPSPESSPVVAPAVAPARPRPAGESALPSPSRISTSTARGDAPRRAGEASHELEPGVMAMLRVQVRIRERLQSVLDLRDTASARPGDESSRQLAARAIAGVVESLDAAGELPSGLDRDVLLKEALNETVGLGPLEALLADESIDEIVVDRPDRVLASKGGWLRPTGKGFSSDEVLRSVIDRLVAPTGCVLNETSPIIDTRLSDGARLTAVVPPAVLHGPCLVLRKSVRVRKSLTELVAAGALSTRMADFLNLCVTARRNLVVCGRPGVGKGDVMSALVGMIHNDERVVTVEDVTDLSLDRRNWIALETRAASAKNPGIDVVQLIRTALRMRPERLVVGDLRGEESLELATALGSAVDGALLIVTGDGSQVALSRWAMLAQLWTPTSTERSVRELIATAADIVVHVVRLADGQLRVASIDEVRGVGAIGFEVQNLFRFYQGSFLASGAIPQFWTDLQARGIDADPAMFNV
jgi:pilus assembly protein CpaF